MALRFLAATSFFSDVRNHRDCLARARELSAVCEEEMRTVLVGAAALKTNPRVHYQDALNAQRDVLILDQTH